MMMQVLPQVPVESKPRLDGEVSLRLAQLCAHLSHLGETQRETNKLLQQYIAQRTEIQPLAEDVDIFPSNSIPGIVYLKAKGMALLVSLNDKQSKKVWCVSCNKKVAVKKSSRGAETACGHMTSCSRCTEEILLLVARCSFCTTAVPSHQQHSEPCPACGSHLTGAAVGVNNLTNLCTHLFVLVRASDPYQCPHSVVGKKRKPQESALQPSAVKRYQPDFSQHSSSTHNPNPNVNAHLHAHPTSVAPVSVPHTEDSYEGLFHLPSPLSTVISPVVGIGKRAIEVGSNILTRMTNYEDDGFDFFM
jgi:hypothetical protein